MVECHAHGNIKWIYGSKAISSSYCGWGISPLGHTALITLAEQYSGRLRYICPDIIFHSLPLSSKCVTIPTGQEGSQHSAASSEYWVPDPQSHKGTDQDLEKDKIFKKEILQPSPILSFEVRKWCPGLSVGETCKSLDTRRNEKNSESCWSSRRQQEGLVG